MYTYFLKNILSIMVYLRIMNTEPQLFSASWLSFPFLELEGSSFVSVMVAKLLERHQEMLWAIFAPLLTRVPLRPKAPQTKTEARDGENQIWCLTSCTHLDQAVPGSR